MIEEALFSVVTGNAGVTALIATRMYPTILPQNPTFPAVSYQHISEERPATFGAVASMPGVLIQVDCWALTFSGVKALARAVRIALDNFKGVAAAETISAVRLENQTDSYEPDVKLHRVLQEYRIWWQES